MTWVLAVPSVGFAVLLMVLASGLRPGHLVAFRLLVGVWSLRWVRAGGWAVGAAGASAQAATV